MTFDDLNKLAQERGHSLREVYRELGFDPKTFWRHRNRRFKPQRSTAHFIAATIKEMPAGVRWKDHWQRELRAEYVRLRRKRKLTQGDVEHLVGVTGSLIAKYEALMRTPNAFILACWADAMGGSLRVIPKEVVPQVDALLEAFYGS